MKLPRLPACKDSLLELALMLGVSYYFRQYKRTSVDQQVGDTVERIANPEEEDLRGFVGSIVTDLAATRLVLMEGAYSM